MTTSPASTSRDEAGKPATESHESTVLITGATTGIGAEAAVDLAERGWRVFVHGRNRKRGEEVVSRIRNIDGEAVFLQADFASPHAVRDLATAIRNRTDYLDALVLNAGLSQSECVNVWGGIEE